MIKKAMIYVRNFAEITFTYTNDADNGDYVISGPGAADVYNVLEAAIKQETQVFAIPPDKFYNPRSFLWILPIIRDNFKNVTFANAPSEEFYPQQKTDPDDDGLDDDGLDDDGLPRVY